MRRREVCVAEALRIFGWSSPGQSIKWGFAVWREGLVRTQFALNAQVIRARKGDEPRGALTAVNLTSGPGAAGVDKWKLIRTVDFSGKFLQL